ncbi:hypothetical protein MPNT_40096 [Candidatus Methylacidithermus pantelleriae]|uniref:Uncharacterized protein n=1 Tax=Candidatus Methylacidithermus pantelleriae TaxID=2744239 RepID=A0A8J2FPA0_9BACT|nr:hypothetical protein MPNT_40096 [Candidatus Methylacidithermus pantelleriae]
MILPCTVWFDCSRVSWPPGPELKGKIGSIRERRPELMEEATERALES